MNKLSQFLQAPTVDHWSACKRLLRYLNGTQNVGICFKPTSQLNLDCFLYADWASSIDGRRSTSGCCVILGGILINYSSKKQPVIARSSSEAEYNALALVTTQLIWLLFLFKELGVKVEQVPVM